MRFTVYIQRTVTSGQDFVIDDPTITTSELAIQRALELAHNDEWNNCVTEYDFACLGVDPNDGTYDSDKDLDDDEPSPDVTDETLPESYDVADERAHEVDYPDEKCVICKKANMPDDLNVAIDQGWSPSYFIGQEERSGPVCPACSKQFINWEDDGVLCVDGEYVIVWDGGHEVRRNECHVKPETREALIEAGDDEGMETLEREYVELNGREYRACHKEEWEKLPAEVQAVTFWWA